jgi:hypothetical protein
MPSAASQEENPAGQQVVSSYEGKLMTGQLTLGSAQKRPAAHATLHCPA